MLKLSLSSTVICRGSLSVELPLSAGGMGPLDGAEETAIKVAPPAIAITMPATTASLAPLFTIFYDI